ncbi:MAG: UDP-galactopyranose mutase [Deltaproteobacteria bacterium]|jgi:UDP-galactopyranose mutase|nr:UDP-galactopyranose mutase [Deltaproteobacteria bacterium]
MVGAKNLIVGGGISGVTLARKLAESGEQVLVVEIKNHIGGNVYDYRDANGIMVHQYGPHIFHTNNKEVWDFISRFTKWRPYHHQVQGLVDGKFVPIPFNLNSLQMVFPSALADRFENKLLDRFGFNKKVPILELRNTDDKDLDFLAEYIYEKIFLEYTIKQWGVEPDKIDPSVSGRVPVYISCDNRYFQDKYQGIPLDGYSAMVWKLLDHPNIEVKLKTPFSQSIEYERLFWTGSVDEFFDTKFGILPYRSIAFDFLTFDYPQFQEVSQVNYPCNYDWTRITEYKHFLRDSSPKTTISFEYPTDFQVGKNDRQYPIANADNAALYTKYLELAKDLPNVYFFGRLGDYKYYNMDQAIARALALFNKVKGVNN